MSDEKFYKTKEFKKLNNKWRKKLEKEGFGDIENGEYTLKEWDSSIAFRYDKHIMASKEEYFNLASKFLFDHEFENNREHTIWRLHADGMSTNEISAKLRSKNFKSTSRTAVHSVIKKLVEAMKVKYGINSGQKRPNSN